MAGPLTPWEEDESWTSVDAETALLTQIDAETTATLTEAGRSVQDRPIWRVDIGNPSGPALFIVSMQHGTERHSREGLLMFIRDVAYSEDPDVLAYLADHRVVALPNVNPDGTFLTYNNANDKNLNREYFRLTQPEAVAVKTTLNDVRPVIVIDAHETNLADATWQPVPSRMPGTHPAILDLSVDLMDTMGAPILADGWTVQEYRWDSYAWSSLGGTQGGLHSVTVLSETSSGWPGATRDIRARMHRQTFHDALAWHHANTVAVDAACTASQQATRTTTAPVPVPDRETIGATSTSITPYTTADVSGYQLAEPIPAHLIDLHGITATDTYVSVNQPARLIIAGLCDPDSLEKVVTATRILRPGPPLPDIPMPDGVPVRAYAQIDGQLRPIKGLYRAEGGTLTPVKL